MNRNRIGYIYNELTDEYDIFGPEGTILYTVQYEDQARHLRDQVQAVYDLGYKDGGYDEYMSNS